MIIYEKAMMALETILSEIMSCVPTHVVALSMCYNLSTQILDIAK